MAKDVLITPASSLVEFQDTGVTVASIYESNTDLHITANGVIVIGDGSPSNIELGDSVTAVTMTFLGGGGIAGGSGTLNIGASGDTVNLNMAGVAYNLPNNVITSVDYTANNVLAKLLTVDGSGSGLDADLLDGLQSTQFVRTDAATSITAAITSSNTFSTTSTSTANIFYSTSNGLGTNYRVGDDAWLGDINLNNTLRLSGVQSANNGYIVFGNADTKALGRAGLGDLTYGGSTVWHAGNDGSGSGLDADLLDGKHGSDYLNLNTAVGGGIFGAPSKSAVGIFPSSSQGMVGFEYNMLHGALERYTVTQSGSAQISLGALFDGQLSPAYSGDGIDPANPWVLLLENLPSVHTQTGGVFGWTSRYWNPSSYKIEGYDVTSTPVWRTWIDTQASPVDSRDLILSLNNMGLAGNYTKIKITIYAAANGELGANGFKKFGLSEIFFHNPEAMRVYQYLDVDKLDGQHGSYYQNASNISTGTLILARGGTNAALTATAGAVAYSNSTSIALTAVGTSGYVLLSGGTSTPTWSSQASLSVGTANNVSGGTVTATSGTFSSTLGVTGAATFANTVGITGTLTTGDLNSTSGTFSGTLGVTGATTFANTVGITGALTATSGRITKELEIGNTSIYANTQTISTASSNTIIDAFYTSEYSTSKYVISYKSTSNTVVFGSTEILVMHNGSTVITSEYSTMYGTDIAFSVDAAIVGSNCNIYASANQGNLVISTTRFSMV